MEFDPADTDFSQIPISALTLDTEAHVDIGDAEGSSFDAEMATLSTRVEQYQWVVSWLEKHSLFRTLDVLLDEGAEIASESFHLAKTVQVEAENLDYAKEEKASFDLHGGQNVLATQFHPNPEIPIIASGSTDRTACLANWKTGEKLVTVYGAHFAPVLCLDWHPTEEGRLVMGSLDSSFSVVDFKGLKQFDSGSPITYDILTQQKLHKKHVVRVKWAPNGKRFATASYDHSILIMEEKTSELGVTTYEQVKEIQFSEAVESIVWTKDGSWLIASVRKDNYLHYFNPENWQETKFNMNSNQADDHVSFTAMDLALSRDDKHLLVSTDKNRAIIYAVAKPLQLRNFYDINNGEWSTPRATFSKSGAFAYISSEDKKIHVYNVSSGTKVTMLTGHTSNVRDVASHPTLDVIASASFDKTIKIWE